MGGPARALRRLGYDLNINQAGNYFDNQRKKQEQLDIYKAVINAYNAANTNLKGIGDATNTITETAQNPFYNPNNTTNDNVGLGNNNVLSLQTGSKPVGLAALNPNVMAREYTDNPTYDKTTVTPISQEEKYNRAKNVLGDFQSSVAPTVLNPEADPSQLSRMNVLGQLIGGQVENLKPKKPERRIIGEGGLEVSTDEFGNEVGRIENKKDFRSTPEKPIERMLEQGNVSGVPGIWFGIPGETPDKNIRTRFQPLRDPSDNGKNGGDPLDTYKFVEKINNTRGKIGEIDATLKNTKPITKDKGGKDYPEPLYQYDGKMYTGKELQAVKSKFENELKGGSDSMISYLEENRYKGITKLTNELWNDIKDTDPQKINTIIENKLNGKAGFQKLPENIKQDLINNLSSYFQSRKY